MTEYVKDFENGYKIQKVFANEWEGTYGDVYDFRNDVEKEHPGANILEGYVVIDVDAGLVPVNCNDWNETISEAMMDYEEHVLLDLTKLPENCFWFALNEEKCISVWYSPDRHDGDQFQIKLEERAEDGSMGPHCEVLIDESYGTRDMSFEALCDTLREVCGDAGITDDAKTDNIISSVAIEILSIYGLEVPTLGMKAVNIEWDVDEVGLEDLDLPTEIEIPEGMTDEEKISDYISEETGFCHKGFDLIKCDKVLARDKKPTVDNLITKAKEKHTYVSKHDAKENDKDLVL